MTQAIDVEWLIDLPSPKRARILQKLTPAERKAVDKALEDDTPWRANPATFAHHLTDGEYKLWPYIKLLGRKFAESVNGEDPNQEWWLPSQLGKTTLIMWGALWILDRSPKTRIMYVSYDADKAVDEGGKARDIAERYASKLRFRLRPDQRARGKWTTSEGGGLYCVGIGGAITGFPQDVLLLDDLIKGWQAAHSAAQRESVWNVYRSQCRLRLQRFDAPKISAGTRWHENDFQARLRQSSEIEHADKWTVVRLPAIAEAPDPLAVDPILRLPDPLGRRPGELLEPERFNREEVLARAAALGEYLASALEQQRPSPPEGLLIKRDWWVVEDSFWPTTFDRVVSSWDMKLKDKESGDYTVGQVWGVTGKDCWLIDQLRGQWPQALTTNAMALVVVRYPACRLHLVEAAGYGPEVMESLRTPAPGYEISDDVAGELGMTKPERHSVNLVRRRGLAGIISVPVKGDKFTRLVAVSGYIQAGDVHLPGWAPWVPVFLEEMSAFNQGTHDDMVDACSQALSRIHRVRRARGSGAAQREIRAGSVG